MSIKLQVAKMGDAAGIAALQTAAAAHLTARFGEGPWSRPTSDKAVLFQMRNATVYVARDEDEPKATLTLATKKPWAIDRKYFTPCKRPLYLTGMAVAPDDQRKGIGRSCIEEALRITKAWPADAIWLDAYDATAGAGEFYRKCGFREVGRAAYKDVPLIYFEMAC